MRHAIHTDIFERDLTVKPDEVLVAVPALNEADAIGDCIRSLVTSGNFMRSVKIVVADGGSTDGTLEKLDRLCVEFPNLVVLRNPAKLQSAGVNAVVENFSTSAHKYLIRCDAHAVYPSGYVKDLTICLAQRPDAASVVVPMDSVGNNSFSKASGWIVESKLGSGGSAHRGKAKSGWIDHGHHAGFRLEWFRKVGGYDITFSHNEDAEYDYRIALEGGRIWLAADIRLDYSMRPTLKKLAKQYWAYGRGRARTILKHRMKPRLRQVIPVIHVALLAITIGLGLIWPIFWYYPGLYTAVLIGASVAGARHFNALGGLWAGPALGAMHLAWGAGFLRQLCSRSQNGVKQK